MSKQDRQGVRTAADLERKYNFSGMKRAIELQELGIQKIEKTTEDFVNAVVRSFTEMRSELDTTAETWFYEGTPTLDTDPANEWTVYEEHYGDLYYDTGTGYVYRFEDDAGTAAWKLVTDPDTVYALALANSAKDTQDHKRSVFLEQPVPPYDRGDMWLTDDNLYICQIGKAAGQEYETADFVVYTKYAEGITLETGAKLEREYSTTVEMNAAIKASNEEITTEMSKTYTTKDEATGIERVAVQASTLAQQTAEGFRQVTTRIENGELDGEDATVLRIDSSRGTVFKNSEVSTVLSAVIYKGSKRITTVEELKAEYGSTAYLEWQWQKYGEDTFGVIVATDERIGNDGFTFTLSPDDVDTKVVFLCNLITD